MAKQATNLVLGTGSVDAAIVCIGEAPGKQEDLLGVPFVGASGKLLDALFESVQLARDDIYITNIVKYRPPNNRDPKPAEKAAFWPYLVAELAIIQPKIVITLGRHSMQYFLPDAVIGDVHGVPHELTLGEGSAAIEITVMPLYHPAAALYNGSLRQTLFDDMQKLPALLSKRN